MLKLKYLFENFEMAKAALANWHHDEATLDKALAWFRISSNAVYPFYRDGRLCFLRMAPVEEKQERNVRGEVEFIEYLVGRGYPAMRPLRADSGADVLVLDTAWGRWYATAFEGVTGRAVDDGDYSDAEMRAYGRALGRLHNLAAEYEPHIKKWDHADALDWVESTLREYGAPECALNEAAAVRSALAELPRSNANYGLVHYDFEPDNVFYDAEKDECSVIDFDDGMYHWYALDIEQALAEVRGELEGGHCARACCEFLKGYAEERPYTQEMERQLPLMRRFCDIFAYARLIRCLSDKFDDEPEWLVELRVKLGGRKVELEKGMQA